MCQEWGPIFFDYFEGGQLELEIFFGLCTCGRLRYVNDDKYPDEVQTGFPSSCVSAGAHLPGVLGETFQVTSSGDVGRNIPGKLLLA